MNQNPQKIVACTYWEGDFRGRENIYNPTWVHRLKAMVELTTPDVEFCCLTNVPDKLRGRVKTIRLVHGLPGWWAKLELFRPALFPAGSSVLSLDIDLLVMKDLTPLFCDPGEFMIGTSVGPFNKTVKRGSHMAGVFSFNPGDRITEGIWTYFIDDPEWPMEHYRGDGRFLDLFGDRFARYPEGWITKLRFCPGAGTAPDPEAFIIHCMPDKNNVAAKKHKWVRKIWKRP